MQVQHSGGAYQRVSSPTSPRSPAPVGEEAPAAEAIDLGAPAGARLQRWCSTPCAVMTGSVVTCAASAVALGVRMVSGGRKLSIAGGIGVAVSIAVAIARICLTPEGDTRRRLEYLAIGGGTVAWVVGACSAAAYKDATGT